MGSEWLYIPLYELCSYLNRGSAPAYAEENGVLVLNQKCVRDQQVSFSEARRTDTTKKPIVRERFLKPFDILVNSTGIGTLGRVAQVRNLSEETTIDSHLTLVRPDPEAIHPFYLGMAVRCFESKIEALGEGSTGQTELSRSRLGSLLIPVPSYEEQRAIAHILGTLDDKIELNRRMNQALEEMARALFKSWFVDFDPVRAKAEGRETGLPEEIAALFPDEFEDSELGEIPKGWSVKQLGNIIEISDSKRIPLSSRERAKRQGPYRYYGAAGIVDYVDDFLFDGVYLLVGEDGTVVTSAGNPVLQYVWGKFWVNNHAHVIRAKGGVTVEHLFLLLQRINATPFITGAVQPKLSQKNMNAIPVIQGPPELNQIFGRLIDPFFAKVRALNDEKDVLVSIRDALLPKLISGEIEVTKAECFTTRHV